MPGALLGSRRRCASASSHPPALVMDACQPRGRMVLRQGCYPVPECCHAAAHFLGGLSACLHARVAAYRCPPASRGIFPSLLPGSSPSRVRQLSNGTMGALRLPLSSIRRLVFGLAAAIPGWRCALRSRRRASPPAASLDVVARWHPGSGYVSWVGDGSPVFHGLPMEALPCSATPPAPSRLTRWRRKGMVPVFSTTRAYPGQTWFSELNSMA